MHKEYSIFVPELIFGHLLTGSNYDDDEKKVVGGRNGFGAKLANIFSKKFIVETSSSKSKKKFKMVWSNNMSSHTSPLISDNDKNDYTCVTFEPDLQKFGMNSLEDDIVSLMKRRVYDMAGILTKVTVHLNQEKLKIKNFSDYADLYFEKENVPKYFDKNQNTDRWSLIVSFSDGEFTQVSFVNSISTSKGG